MADYTLSDINALRQRIEREHHEAFAPADPTQCYSSPSIPPAQLEEMVRTAVAAGITSTEKGE